MKTRLYSIGALIAAITVITSGGLWWYSHRAEDGVAAESGVRASDGPASESGASEAPTSVELSQEKRRVAGVSLGKAATKTLRAEHLVPGRLQYDDRRHVEVRSAAEGIITDIRMRSH